jgi:hypothetical protein
MPDIEQPGAAITVATLVQTGTRSYGGVGVPPNLPPDGSPWRERDTWIDTSTGQVYERSGDGFIETINIKGPKGDIGSQGVQGQTGTQGATGSQGEVGAQGLRGETGPQGSTGVKGDTGAKGDIGNTGAPGPSGSQGLKGDTGSQGAVGVQGVKGDIGLTGSQGLKGDTGNVGPTGAQGSTGNVGATGLQGATGLTGAQGPIGLTGTTGATGSQGPIGVTGAVGATGAQGPTGPQGIAGTNATPSILTLTISSSPYTLVPTPGSSPTRVFAYLTASIANPTVVLGESGIQQMSELTIVNVGSTNSFIIADVSGTSEQSGNFTVGPTDTISYVYGTDRWYESGRSNN